MVNNKGLLRSQNCLSITLQVKCKVSANLSLLELCRTVAFTRNCNLYYNCKVTKNNRHYQIFVYFSLVIQKQFVSLQADKQTTEAMSIETMTQLIADYFKTQPVLKVWLFGSYSRGEQNADSDVDLLIVPDNMGGLFKLSGMMLDLQDLLQKRVDLVTEKGLLPFARESVDRDKILIYERAA